MSFVQRAPSIAWEPIPLPTKPPVVIWGWFKPALASHTVVLQLPPDLWKSGVSPDQLTLRLLANATGVDSLVGWTLYGQSMPLNEQTMKWLDAQLPECQPGGDAQLMLWSQTAEKPTQETAKPEATPEEISNAAGLMPGEDPGPYFELIESLWTSILYAESDIRRVRMQLDQSISKLTSLDRELTFEEVYAADSADKQQWQDARRRLREAAGSLSRSLRDVDLELQSSTNQRNRFLGVYEQFVKPRLTFAGLKQTVLEFDAHFKTAKMSLQGAQAALHKGASDVERRANAILQRIHQKAQQKNDPARGKNA